MRVALDAMGGDRAPTAMVEGAIEAVRTMDSIEVVLVGRKDVLERELAVRDASSDRLKIHHAQEVVSMDDPAGSALRAKRDSSITRAVELVARHECDAVFSAGNTGAAVAASSVLLRNLPGVERPGIAICYTTDHGPIMIIDVGANIYCKPLHLKQYGVMAAVYSEHVVGVEAPTVGLLNVGEEDAKGNDLAKAAYRLLSRSALRFVGNVEGSGIPQLQSDIIVCEGFVGNVVLKVMEGLSASLLDSVERMASTSGASGDRLRQVLGTLRSRCDYTEHGGAPLLGVNGISMIGHGHSTARAVTSAIKIATDFARFHINDRIVESLEK